MGTHPIFESDFDCLTEMNNNGNGAVRDDKMESWNSDEVCEWLRARLSADASEDLFDKEKIAELVTFIEHSSHESLIDVIKKLKACEPLETISLNKPQRNKLHDLMQRQDTAVPPGKTYFDGVYGPVKLSPLIEVIRKQPEFVRLRRIKQLGCADYVYSTAVGNRYQHSIGTAILTKRFLSVFLLSDEKVRKLHEIEEKDITCVEIAALCHDLGHALLSHFFDGRFVAEKLPIPDPYDPDNKEKWITEWNHEIASRLLIDIILRREEVINVLADLGMNEKDTMFIGELIDPDALKNLAPQDPWPMKGRGEGKAFLYELVSNKRNGIDTDKLDYLARDSKMCRSKDNLPALDRMFMNTRIVFEKENQNRTLLAFEEKLYSEHTIHEIFKARLSNHRQIYQHRDGCAAELMLGDALNLVQNSYKVEGADGRLYKLHEAIHCMEAYCKVTDCIIDDILQGDMALRLVKIEYGPEEVEKWLQARALINRALSGDFYVCLGQIEVPPGKKHELSSPKTIAAMKKEIVGHTNRQLAINAEPEVITMDDLIHREQKYNWGNKEDKTPMREVPFVQPSKVLPVYFEQKESAPLEPQTYSEFHIRLYCKKRCAKNEASLAFKKYCSGAKLSFTGHQDLGPTTPMKPLTPQTDINGRKRKSKVESGSLTKRSLIFDDMEE